MSTGFPNSIAIVRTDSIGDVVVTLPMCGYIKEHSPNTRIVFVGKSYTADVIAACPFVDEFINFDDRMNVRLDVEAAVFAFPDKEAMKWVKSQGVRVRVATAKRKQSWLYATERVWFSRKNSEFHESQLNFNLLRPFGLLQLPTFSEIQRWHVLKPQVVSPIALESGKRAVIFHMLSKGSALNWSLASFEALAQRLSPEEYSIYLTGTAAEGERIREVFGSYTHVHDITGQLSLSQLIAFIASCESLVAASTGPLHLASALGIRAVGLFSSRRPMHPGRWRPIDEKSIVLEDGITEVGPHELQISVQEVVKVLGEDPAIV